MVKIFPITRAAYETPNFTQSAYEYREAFLGAWKELDEQVRRREGYYAYDVVIHSRTQVEFIVYDMRDNCRGGIGKETRRLTARVKASLTRPDVEREIYRWAEARRSAELLAAEERIISGYATEIRASMRVAK